MGRRYRLLAKLEEGALAEHYKGAAEGAGASDVLIKLFSAKASDPIYAKALADTGTRTRALGNPAAVGFDEVGLVRARIAAVRPYIDGYNLGDALRRLASKEVVLAPALALWIVAEAAQVVASAHRAGWVHGAITPGNILLGSDGKVRVVDFGALEALNASPALRPLVSKGRNAYRAPEIRGSVLGAPAADVYSLGAIAYELLTLRDVASVRGGALSTKRDSLTPPSRLDRRLNARMDPVIMRALDTAAPRRYKNASDHAEALRGLFSVLGYAPGAGDSVRFVKELFPNEVAVGGAMAGGVPFAEPFELETIEGAVHTGELPAVLEDRAAFTSGAIPVVELPSPHDTDATSPVPPTEPPLTATKPVEEWDAPPGAMPDAPRLARRGRRGERPAPAETVEQRLPDSEVTDVPPRRAELPSDTPEEQPAIPDAGFDEGDLSGAHPATSNDWHVPPEPPRPKPKPPSVGFPVWALAVIVCLSIALFMYVAVGRRLGLRSSGSLDLSGVKVPNLGPTPVPVPVPTPVPARDPAPEPASGALTVDSDREALVFLDGKPVGKTPLRLAVASGSHTVRLTSGGISREKVVTLKPGGDEKVVLHFVVKRPPRHKGKGSR